MMSVVRTSVLTVLVLATLVGIAFAQEQPAAKPEPRDVDIAICLDTSGSMDGLIESAKQKLWAIVNELATAEPKPRLRVALYQYGNDGLNSETGWVQQICELTSDLDKVYGKLFELKTNGGTEYVARVADRAAKDLKWSEQKNALKIIVVAGNEEATQDNKLKLQDVCKATITKGIMINTIFCGDEAEGRKTGWADAAAWADGRYAAIDQNSGTVVVNTKYDKELTDLSAKLNTTYVGYGARRAEGAAMQKAQDENAAATSQPSVSAERAKAKSSGLYKNAGWDLVDAVKEGKKLDDFKDEDLPDEMKKMSPEERKKYVEKMSAEREALQKKVLELSKLRDAAVQEEMTKKGLSDKSAFDAALRATIREQAKSKGIEFKEEAKTPATAPAAPASK